MLTGNITVEETNDRDKHNRYLILNNKVPFTSCISNINETLTMQKTLML